MPRMEESLFQELIRKVQLALDTKVACPCWSVIVSSGETCLFSRAVHSLPTVGKC